MGNSPSLLLDAVRTRDKARFQGIIPKINEYGVNVDYADEEGKTALHWASSIGDTEIISALLDAGANVEKQDLQGYTALTAAVFTGQAKAAELLIEKGKSTIDAANRDGMTPLHWAIVEKQFDCVDLLIKKGASLELKNNKGQTPMEIVARLKPKSRSKMEQFIFGCIDKYRGGASSAVISSPKTVPGSPKALSNAERADLKNRRLAVLCKLWGVVKFMHPYLTYKNVDWDSALLKIIPKVNGASSAQEYQQVLNELLEILEDPNTRCLNSDANKPVQPVEAENEPEQPYVKTLEGGVGVLVVTHHEKFIDYQHKMMPLITCFREISSPKMKSLVFDVRLKKGTNINASIYPFKFMFYEAFRSTLLSKEIQLAAFRQRMITGFPQSRNFGNIFHSGINITEGEKVDPTVPGLQLPNRTIVFLMNKGTPDTVVDLAVALQVAGVAKIVVEKMEGELPVELGIQTFLVNVGENLVAHVRKNERINGDGSLGYVADAVVNYDPSQKRDDPLETAIQIANGSKVLATVPRVKADPYLMKVSDKEFAENSYPSAELRLLSLFRFWNIIQYFYPYKNLIERNWDEVITEFIPKFENAKNDLEYHLAVAELVCYLKDSHSSTTSPVINNYIGTWQPPIELKYVENKTIVSFLFDPMLQAKGLSIGDEIVGFEKEDIEERKKKLSQVLPASTKQALQLKIHQKLLSGEKDSQLIVKVRSTDGQVRSVLLNRTMLPLPKPPMKNTYSVLPEGYGFIDTVNLVQSDFDKAFEAIKDTPALILDIRGYPKGTVYQLAPRLTDKRVTVAITQTPVFLPSMLYSELEPCLIEEKHRLLPNNLPKYRGKIVALINEETISHAEHSCLYLSASTDVTFVGTPSNGSNGNVTNCALPGGILIAFTGLGTLHGNKEQLQRKGIQPRVTIEPTIEGFRKNIDEVLLKAVEYLKQQKISKH